MKHPFLAAALLAAAAPFAMAQAADAPKAPDTSAPEVKAPDVPKPTCGAAPELPGRTMMQDSAVRKRFEEDVRGYTQCMKTYKAEREAAAKANMDAGNKAVNDYNAWAEALKVEQEKRRGVSNEGGAAPASRTY
jgi:hypothetical protein